jgi:hypothetical protein
MDTDKSDEVGWGTVVIQFPVAGVETDAEEARRCRLQALLNEALAASDNGSDGGEDIGSEKGNIFLDVHDADRAVTTALDVLRRADFLDGVVIAEMTDNGFVVRWPVGHAGKFSLS